MVLLKNNNVCFEIRRMYRSYDNERDIYLVGVECMKKEEPFFDHPTDAAKLGIFHLSGHISDEEITINISQVKQKVVKLVAKPEENTNDTSVAVSYLH